MRTSDKTAGLATRVLICIAAVAVLAGLASCARRVEPGPYKAVTYSPSSIETTDTLVLMDKDLQAMISVDGQRAGYLPDGRLKAETNIRNMLPQPLTVQVQTLFRDDAGMASGDATAWQNLLLNGNATETYSAVALNAQSTRYTIRIRLPQ